CKRGVDFVRGPPRCFVPDCAFTVSPRRNEIYPAVAIHVGRHDIGCALLVGCNHMLRPGPAGVFRLLPPGEPISVRTDFGCTGDVRAAVAVHVAEAEVVAETGCVPVRKDIALPTLSRSWARRDSEPRKRIWEMTVRLGTVADQVRPAIAIHIACRKPVNAIYAAALGIVDHVIPPLLP